MRWPAENKVHSLLAIYRAANAWEDVSRFFRRDLQHVDPRADLNVLPPVQQESVRFVRLMDALAGMLNVLEVRGDGFCLLHAVNAVLTLDAPLTLESLEAVLPVYEAALATDAVRHIKEDLAKVARGEVVNDLAEDWLELIAKHMDRSILLIDHDRAVLMNKTAHDTYYVIRRANHFYAAALSGTTTKRALLETLQKHVLYFETE